ncbi:MAG: DinB family protein [Acidobacteriia bacterium]|nr:DinB family protein [Terriglobia bacterium]
MDYRFIAIPDADVPAASNPLWQHAIDTYASETNKVASVWREFATEQLAFRPHPRSSSAGEIMRHQLLSERRFFGEFLGTPEPAAAQVLPLEQTPEACTHRLVELARARLDFLARQSDPWWLQTVQFFDVERQRIWIFWRRVLHTAHHRTQLTVYLRLLEKAVVPTYGPTADVTWEGADPTLTAGAAERK